MELFVPQQRNFVGSRMLFIAAARENACRAEENIK
jgi:hypothetical protein